VAGARGGPDRRLNARAAPLEAAAQRWTLVAAVLGSSIAFLDGTIVNVALPAIQGELGADAAQAQWVIESYALFLAALLLVGGALGDRHGRRRVFMAGVALFTLAGGACAAAPTAWALIAARAVQGVGAALLVPGSLALISANFPQERRGAAIGTWSAFSGIAAAVGPVVGGFLIDHASWRWAFLINLPLGAALLLVCRAKVPRDAPPARPAPLDAAGAVLGTLGLAGVVFACIEAPGRGWGSAPVLAAAALGTASLALFARTEARSPHPMLPPALLRVRTFAGANLLTLLLYAALGGGLYYLPLNLIQVQGWGAAAAGAALLPFVAILFLLSGWAGRLVDRIGPRVPLVAGPLVAAAGFALFARPGVGLSYWRDLLPAVCVLGLGMAITVAPLTTTVMNAVERERAGLASGINNAVSRTGGLLAIAAFGILMAASFERTLERELARRGVPPALAAQVQAQRHQLAAIRVPDGADAAAARAVEQAVGTAFVAGFRHVMLACSALALLSALSAWALIGGRPCRPVP
jgi:EmrB/QacA subfamily drug resistance transporter